VRGLISHLRYTVRLLLKSPGFTVTAVLILGRGIGANSAIFSLINNVVLKPLPFPDPDRLVKLSMPLQHLEDTKFDYPDYEDINRIQESFQSLPALVLARFIQGVLYGVSSNDPITLGIVVLVLALAGLLACLLPALRATRTDPIRALRE